MPTLSELSIPLFKNAEGKTNAETIIFYGTALQDSANGEVLIQLDQAIYPLGENEDDLKVNVKINDDVANIEEDADASTDLVYYEEA